MHLCRAICAASVRAPALGHSVGMFKNRIEAGKRLAEALAEYKGTNAIVLALPRGGVPVGYEIARALKCPLDTIVARKVGAPGDPEYALGAIAPRGAHIIEGSVPGIERIVEEETIEMRRRMKSYKSGSYVRGVEPETVILVDDGVATGKTARAALRSVRSLYKKAALIFAVPVGAPEAIADIRREAVVVSLEEPEDFIAVGQWYEHFPQLSDAEVKEFLEGAFDV